MATKYTTTNSEGATATRTTERRTYTHAVWATRSTERIKADAAANYKRYTSNVEKYTAALRNSKGELVAIVSGKASNVFMTDRKEVEAWAEQFRVLATEAARVEFHPESAAKPFECMAWAGSLALAQAKAASLRKEGYRVEITAAVEL